MEPVTAMLGNVFWTVDEVMGLASQPNINQPLTDEEALEFIADHQEAFRDRLFELGWEVLDDMLVEWLEEKNEEFRVNSLPCEPVMTNLGWRYWQTGGGCTAWGYNIEPGEDQGIACGRYLLMTSVVHDCSAPDTLKGERILVGLYDQDGEYVEYHEFLSVEEFLEAWDGPYAPPGMMTQELFDQMMGEG
ncbi:hypothetical protein DFAR_3060044 [Desulfarculales bacterium]